MQFPGSGQVTLGQDRTFTYDYVYHEMHSQTEVYHGCVSPLVIAYLRGYNATILAYGQTGSGKTFTMGTASSKGVSDSDLGILPRVIKIGRAVQQECRDRSRMPSSA
eukprot:TRINITY_DN101289_c0_g2_i1.p1 TRINITY_DN101289_c0_g2~~TRINITY_DN101289_c0_g2_i1.p1  ORF type:complete len:107 (+),score=12.37 TRINITY_DN101289_c0_g2_i1:155-475(+)